MHPAAVFTLIVGEALIAVFVVAVRIEQAIDRRAFVLTVDEMERDVRIGK